MRLIKERFLNQIIPISTFIFLTTAVLVLYALSIEKHYSVIEQQLADTGQLLAKEFKNTVKSDISRLKNLKNRLEKSNGDYFLSWENDANLILQQNSSFKFIEWIDSSMVIRKIVPYKGNEKVLNLDISKIEYRKDDWINHSQRNVINMTSWVKLTQNGHSFLVDVPVNFDNKFQGTITAGMNFETNFNRLVDYLEDQYAVEIYDNKNTLFFDTNTDIKLDSPKNISYSNTISVNEADHLQWKINVFPSNKLILAESKAVTDVALAMGLLMALITSLLTYFYIRAKKSTAYAKHSNMALKKANQTLNLERDKAQKASQAKTDFLSNMSHEIRTPLHAIVGFIELLKDSEINKTNREYLGLMEKSSNNLLHIVNDILDFEKIESGKIELTKNNFNPIQRVKELIDVNQLIFSKKGLTLQANFENTHNVNVIGDESKLLQITNNILKNGLKFTNTGGVTLTYSESIINNEELKISISIKDTGIGIPKDKINSIFERFTQIENSIKKQYEGSGLGLAISKIFINMMGGEISVKSEENAGSEFQFYMVFPISKKSNSNQINTFKKRTDLAKLDVLIVDDNNINILVLKKFLQDMDMIPDIAKNGKDAVALTKNKDYQLIFMDIHMPEMNGWEATKEIRKINKDAVIFGISANVTKDAINQSIDTGMDNYLTKPFKKSHLEQLLQYHFHDTNTPETKKHPNFL